jgi:hypothetical protein
MGAPEEGWARITTILLQGLTLVAALIVSGVHRRVVHAAAVVAIVALIGATLLSLGDGEYELHGGGLLGLLLSSLAPAAIIWGVVGEARRAGQISLRTMFGVLCVYLLIGSAFGFTYQAIAAFEDGAFFAETSHANPQDFLYFSFTTMTTTGFGDLTAAHDFGRSLAITEALIGQIYLVTLVALIVSNLGRPTRRP